MSFRLALGDPADGQELPPQALGSLSWIGDPGALGPEGLSGPFRPWRWPVEGKEHGL